MKLEAFKGKPKRKYVRKQKESETNTLNTFILDEDETIDKNYINEDNINDSNTNDISEKDLNIINELDNEINNNLSKSVKRMKINNDNDLSLKPINISSFKKSENLDTIQNNIELLSTLNRVKPSNIKQIEKVYYNPLNVNEYEFMSPINVYLYYVSEKISKNVTKYIIYTHIYKHIDHHILCPTKEPPNYSAKESVIKKEEVIHLAPNVKLYVREYEQTMRNYTYQNCSKVLNNVNHNYHTIEINKKRKKDDIENSYDYNFCQLYLENIEYKRVNSYIFEYENKYFSFTYNIYDKNKSDIKLLTNGE